MKTDMEDEGGMEKEDDGRRVLTVAPAGDRASHPSLLPGCNRGQPELPVSPQSVVERKANVRRNSAASVFRGLRRLYASSPGLV